MRYFKELVRLIEHPKHTTTFSFFSNLIDEMHKIIV